MQKIWKAALAVVVGVGLVVPATAQNSYVRLVQNLLGLQHRYEDFEPANVADWVGELRAVGQNRQVEQSYELEANTTYRVVGACDQDCSNMDLELFDPSGAQVGASLLPDDHPYVEITPTVAGTYRAHAWVVSCRARPCYGGLRLLKRQPRQRSGTAFLISAAGHLLTNAHVVQGRNNVHVFVGGQEVPARVLMRDPANDVALLQADIHGTPLRLASATTAQRGQEVMAVGYPLVTLQGENQKATFGRINALSGLEDDIRYLQIDAAVQPGNSGGPLINARGDVVGIVSATINQRAVAAAADTVAQNVNYALKIDYALPMLPPEARPTLPAAPAAAGFEDSARRAESSVYRITAE